MAKDDPFDNPSAMLRWFEMPEGSIFLSYVYRLLEFSQLRLEKETDLVDIYRRQGRVDALKDINNLTEELRQQIKRKAA